MATGYKITTNSGDGANVVFGGDLDDICESFTLEEQSNYGVTDSVFTDGSGRFRKNGIDLKTALGRTFPTAQYEDTSARFLRNGQRISVQGKSSAGGMRPIGIPLATLGVGEWYIQKRQVSGESQTWIRKLESTGAITDYLRLPHDPFYMYAEIVGGGGGGAGSGLTYCSGGGGAGGWALIKLYAESNTNNAITIKVGAGGNGGGNGEDGQKGEDSTIKRSGRDGVIAYGGNGGVANSSSQASGGGTSYDDSFGSGMFVGKTGGNGGGKEGNGGGISTFSFDLPNKPEQTQWTRGNTSGGASSGNNYGGGGGASALANGAPGNSRKDGVAGTLGAGGSGAGYTAFNESSGGKGGDGVCYIYY